MRHQPGEAPARDAGEVAQTPLKNHFGLTRRELEIVRVVHHRVHALDLVFRDVVAIHARGLLVDMRRDLVLAQPAIDVCGHVHQVSCSRREALERVRRAERPLGMRGRLDRVNVEMVREGMLEVEFQDGIERRNDFVGPRLRLALWRPLIPRSQIHHRLGK